MDDHSPLNVDIETSEPTKKGLTRRQVAVGAAWAVPVVALAVGSPARAASEDAWQSNLFAQFSLVSSNLNVGSYKAGTKTTIIRAQAPQKLIILNKNT